MFHFLKRAVSDSVETNKCASQLCKTAAGCQAPRGGEGPSLGQAHPAQQTPAPVLGGLPLPRRPEPSAHSCVQLGGAGGFCFLPSPAARGGRGRLAGFTSSGPAPARRHSRGEGVRPGSRIRGSQSRRMGQWARRRRGARRRGRAGAALKPGAPAPPCSPRSPASAPPLQGPPLVVGGGGMRAPALGGGGREPRSLRWTRSRFFPAGAEAAAPAAQEACTQQGATPG